MMRIESFNVPKDCYCEEFCGSQAEYFEVVEINSLDIAITLCPQHRQLYEQYENNSSTSVTIRT